MTNGPRPLPHPSIISSPDQARVRNSKPHVVYWNNIPNPYMVDRFNALTHRAHLYFEAWFSDRTAPDRSWEIDESDWAFKYRYLPRFTIAGRHAVLPMPLCWGQLPDLVVSLYHSPSFLAGWQLARLRNARTAFWTEVTFDSWVRRRSWKETAKRQIFRRVDGVITPGEDGRCFASRYGAPHDRIHFAQHRVDAGYFAAGVAQAKKSRQSHRSKLGLVGFTFAYVGRLWAGKGLDYLLDAFAVLQRRVQTSTSLLLVGDGEEQERLRARCKDEGIANVIFAGFRQKEELPAFYAAADVFVFPTLGDPYGLAVDEALSSGLPVVSTSAAGEIRTRVQDGTNGFVVPPRNSAALLAAMERLAVDLPLRDRMAEASTKSMEGQTPDWWAQDFEKAVERILAMPKA